MSTPRETSSRAMTRKKVALMADPNRLGTLVVGQTTTQP